MSEFKIARYFVNKAATTFDLERVAELRKEFKVSIANGAVDKGFETVCHTVFLTEDFPSIAKWAESKGIEVVKVGKADPAENPDSEVKDINSKPAPKKRGRRPASTTEEVTINEF